MHISKKSEYAILGLLYLACQPKEKFVQAGEIVAVNRISKDLLLKIFNLLVQNEILESKAGKAGGFRLKKKPKDITLWDIFNLFESSPYLIDCVSYKGCAKSGYCSMALIWKDLQKDIDKVFQKVNFQTLGKNAVKYANFIPLA